MQNEEGSRIKRDRMGPYIVNLHQAFDCFRLGATTTSIALQGNLTRERELLGMLMAVEVSVGVS